MNIHVGIHIKVNICIRVHIHTPIHIHIHTHIHTHIISCTYMQCEPSLGHPLAVLALPSGSSPHFGFLQAKRTRRAPAHCCCGDIRRNAMRCRGSFQALRPEGPQGVVQVLASLQCCHVLVRLYACTHRCVHACINLPDIEPSHGMLRVVPVCIASLFAE
jgi:hypothetical protein